MEGPEGPEPQHRQDRGRRHGERRPEHRLHDHGHEQRARPTPRESRSTTRCPSVPASTGRRRPDNANCSISGVAPSRDAQLRPGHVGGRWWLALGARAERHDRCQLRHVQQHSHLHLDQRGVRLRTTPRSPSTAARFRSSRTASRAVRSPTPEPCSRSMALTPTPIRTSPSPTTPPRRHPTRPPTPARCASPGSLPGEYTITETTAPTGYAVDTGPKTCHCGPGSTCASPGTGTVTFVDPPLYDIQVNFRDGGSGETSPTSISCTATDGTGSTTAATGWDDSLTFEDEPLTTNPETIVCTIVVDP